MVDLLCEYFEWPQEKASELASEYGFGRALLRQPYRGYTALTNADILKMSAAGLPEQLIIEKIDSSSSAFQLDTDSLAGLKKAGVSDAVIAAMMKRERKGS